MLNQGKELLAAQTHENDTLSPDRARAAADRSLHGERRPDKLPEKSRLDHPDIPSLYPSDLQTGPRRGAAQYRPALRVP